MYIQGLNTVFKNRDQLFLYNPLELFRLKKMCQYRLFFDFTIIPEYSYSNFLTAE
jgi:hypothetical protein